MSTTTPEIEAPHQSSFGWHLPPVAIVPHGIDDRPARGPAGSIGRRRCRARGVARRAGVRANQAGDGARSPERGGALSPSARQIIAGHDAALFALTSLSETIGRAALEAMRRGDEMADWVAGRQKRLAKMRQAKAE